MHIYIRVHTCSRAIKLNKNHHTQLSYQRGRTVPVRLTLTSTHDVLSTITRTHPPTFVGELTLRHKAPPGFASVGSALAWRAEQALPRVVWKAVAEKTGASIAESRTVTLEGELSIPPSSQPSFTFGGLAAYVSTCVHDT